MTRLASSAEQPECGAQLLAGAGVARVHPREARRAADEVDEPLASLAGDPERDLGALERVPSSADRRAGRRPRR